MNNEHFFKRSNACEDEGAGSQREAGGMSTQASGPHTQRAASS